MQLSINTNLPKPILEDAAQKRKQTAKGAPKASALAVTMNLITATLGCGILSLPWATAGCSVLPAAVMTLLVLILNGCTLMILVYAAESAKIYDLGSLFKRIPRRWGLPARIFTDLTIWGGCFLCLVGDLIVASDSVTPLLRICPSLASKGRSASLPVVFLLAVPLCTLDQKHLAFSSTAAVMANVYTLVLILVLFYGENNGTVAEDVCLLNWGPGVMCMLSVLMQSVIMQMCVLPMYEVLERRSPKRFLGCLVAALTFVFFLFVAFSVSAYMFYGPGINSNVLNNLPNNLAGDIARVGMCISALAVYPIMLLSMISPIQHSEQRAARRRKDFMFPSPKWEPTQSACHSPASPGNNSPWSPNKSAKNQVAKSPWARDGAAAGLLSEEDILSLDALAALPDNDGQYWSTGSALSGWPSWVPSWEDVIRKLPAKLSTVMSILVIVVSGIGALVLPDLGTVNIYAGAMSVAGLVALAPALVGMFFMGRQSILWFLCMVALLLFGATSTFLELKYTYRDVKEVNANCRWRIH